jgi:indolepyruvate ferredoxin oxidoreductase beta subunit
MVLLGALASTGLLDRFVDISRLKARIAELPMADKNLMAFDEGYGTCSKLCRLSG